MSKYFNEYPSDLSVLDVDGNIFRYVTKGKNGYPLVLIHGALCDSRYWKYQVKTLSKVFQVYALCLRSYWPERWIPGCKFSIQQHANDVQNFIEKVVKNPVHLLGHSRGGTIALEIAKRHPNFLCSAVLCEPNIHFQNKDQSIQRFSGEILNLLSQNRIEESLELFVNHTNGAKIWNSLASWFKTMIRDNASTLFPQITESRLDIKKEQISSIEIPILLFGGQLSPKSYRITLDKLHEILPNSKRFDIPLASHGMNLSNPKNFNSILIKTLSKLEYGNRN